MKVTITMNLEDWRQIETALVLAAETYSDGKFKLADHGQAAAATAYAGQAERYRALGEAIRQHTDPC